MVFPRFASVFFLSKAINRVLATGYRSQDDQRLSPSQDCTGQGGVWRLMGDILPTGKEPQKRPALLCEMVPNRPA
jgi:hypothetical protein